MNETGVFKEDSPIPIFEDVVVPSELEQVLDNNQATEYSQEDNNEIVQPIIEDIEEEKDEDEKKLRVMKISKNHRVIFKRNKKNYKKTIMKLLKIEQKQKQKSLYENNNASLTIAQLHHMESLLWGDFYLEPDTEEIEEKEEEEEVKETDEVAIDASGSATPIAENLDILSETMSKLLISNEILEDIESTERMIEFEMESSEQQPLCRISPEKKVYNVLGSKVASTHTKDIQCDVLNKPGEVEVNLDPAELELAGDVETIVAKREQKMKDQQK